MLLFLSRVPLLLRRAPAMPPARPRRACRARSPPARAASACSSSSAPSIGASSAWSGAEESGGAGSEESDDGFPEGSDGGCREEEDAGPVSSALADAPRMFDAAEIAAFRATLVPWFCRVRRLFPWRAEPGKPWPREPGEAGGAYAVWVSEVMSQQTRIDVVVGYFKRWMAEFPTVFALADAPLERATAIWQGLGYYRRCRFLHEGAKQVVEEYGGLVPSEAAQLRKIKGIGQYTAGAISSIAYGRAEPLVDGNVERVFARMRPGLVGAKNAEYWDVAASCIKDIECAGTFNEALMELGATVCKPKAVACASCPVRRLCGAHAEAVQLGVDPSTYVTRYPVKDPKKKTKVRAEYVAVCVVAARADDDEMRYLVLQRPKDGLLGGLWEAPNVILGSEDNTAADAHRAKIDAVLSATVPQALGSCMTNSSSVRESASFVADAGRVTHVFSHIRQTLLVELVILDSILSKVLAKTGALASDTQFRWVSKAEFAESEQTPVATQMQKVFKAALRKLPPEAGVKPARKRLRRSPE